MGCRRRVIVHAEAAFWTALVIDEATPTSAQGRRLTADEFATWKALAPGLKEKLTYEAKAIRRLVEAKKVQGGAR